MLTALIAAALLLVSGPARAQTITTVNENLATSSNTMLVDTNSNRLDVGTASYTGSVPGAALFVGSNVVVGTGTGARSEVVIYATGTIMIGGVKVSTGDPSVVYVPYSGATADVNIGTHKLFAGQFGAGTSPSTNFLFDGLGTAGGYVRIGAGTNQATGFYWGGARGYSMQERYDLTGTPFTLHDELNNVDRFYLDTSGGWYFPGSITASSGTFLNTGAGQYALSLSTSITFAQSAGNGLGIRWGDGSISTTAASGGSGTSTFPSTGVYAGAGLAGAGIASNPLIVNQGTGFAFTASTFSVGGSTFSIAGGSATFGYGITDKSETITGTGVGVYNLLLSSSIQFHQGTTAIGVQWGDGSVSTSAAGSQGPAGPAGAAGSPSGTLGFIQDKFLGLTNGVTKIFTLTYTPSSGSEHVKLDGHVLSGTSDYTLVTNVVTMTTAPATACTGAAPFNCTSEFEVDYATGASGVNAVLQNSSFSVVGFASGFLHVIGTATVSAVVSYTFNANDIIPGAVISSSYSYRMYISGNNNTTGGLWEVRFNGNSGSNYFYVNACPNTGGGSNTPSSESTTQGLLSDGNAVDAGDPVRGSIDFSSISPSSVLVYYSNDIVHNIGTANRDAHCVGGGHFNGSNASLSSVTFLTSGGTFTGQLILYRTDVFYP